MTASDRISRHWYDLARLSEHEVGEVALEDSDLLADVVAVKNVHFSRSTSHYEDCTTGGIRLVPDQTGLDALRADYAEMTNSGMFRGEPPEFGWVIDRVAMLQTVINAALRRTTA